MGPVVSALVSDIAAATADAAIVDAAVNRLLHRLRRQREGSEELLERAAPARPAIVRQGADWGVGPPPARRCGPNCLAMRGPGCRSVPWVYPRLCACRERGA